MWYHSVIKDVEERQMLWKGIIGLKSLRRIFFHLCSGSICWSVEVDTKCQPEAPYSPHRVWCTQLEATCSMWLQLSSMCLISTRRMCSGVQQTLAGSLVIPMSPMGHWPMVPPVFWWDGSWDMDKILLGDYHQGSLSLKMGDLFRDLLPTERGIPRGCMS